MAGQLSQQEIDRLVESASSGEIPEADLESEAGESSVEPYDFRRPAQVSNDHLKTIRTLHESYSEMFGYYLASQVQTMTSVNLIGVDLLRYSEYIISIASPSVLYVYEINQNNCQAIIELSPELVFAVVERLLGGTGGDGLTSRGITAIEQKIIEPVVLQSLRILADAWQPVEALSFGKAAYESNPEFVQIVAPNETVMVISFEVRISESNYMMNICYPAFLFDGLISNGQQKEESPLQQRTRLMNQKKIETHLNGTRMEVSAILGQAQISVQDLFELETGDVLTLDQKVDDDIRIYIKERLKYLGRPGTVDGRLAVQILTEAEQI